MSCQAFEPMLSSYIDGELSPADAKTLEEHLAVCTECRKAVEEIRALKLALEALEREELPSGLHESIMSCVSSSDTLPKKGFLDGLSGRFFRGIRGHWAPAVAALAVLAVFVGFGSGILWRSMKRSDFAFPGSSPMATESDWSGSESPSLQMRAAAPSDYGDEVRAELGSLTQMSLADAQIEKKIIRHADISLEVPKGDIVQVSEEAISLVKAALGYVESSSITQSSGVSSKNEIANFYMVARVPEDRLDNTINGIAALGAPTRQDTSSRDVTEQYVDIDARLRNKENQETRLLTIMGEAETVGELLQVEGELTRVRGDIESMKAQLMRFDKSCAMSTLSLAVSEEGAYVPPSPWQWQELWRTFVYAWRSLLLVVAQVLPTLLVLGLVIFAVALLIRRRRSRTAS